MTRLSLVSLIWTLSTLSTCHCIEFDFGDQSHGEVELHADIPIEKMDPPIGQEICRNPEHIHVIGSNIESLTLRCRSMSLITNSYQSMGVFWGDSGMPDLESRVTGHRRLNVCKNGNYTCHYCWIKDKSGNTQGSAGYIFYFGITTITSFFSERQITRLVNSSTVLDCWTSTSIIQETHTIRWTYGMRELKHASANTSLYLANLTTLDSGLYGCTIHFQDSMIKYVRQFDLTVLDYPEQPIDLRLIEIGRDDYGAYTVKMNWSQSASDDQYTVTNMFGTYPTGQTSDVNEITLSLSYGKKYLFEVRAENQFGSSEPSNAVFFVTRDDEGRRYNGYDKRLVLAENSSDVRLDCFGYENHTDVVWSHESRVLLNCTQGQECPMMIDRMTKDQEGHYICTAPMPGITMKIVVRIDILQPPRQPAYSFTCIAFNNR